MGLFSYFLILFVFAFFEFIASFTFNFKIHKIAKEEFTKAAFLGMIATIVSSIGIPIIAFFGLQIMKNDSSFLGLEGFAAATLIVLLGAILAAIGNYISTIIIPYIDHHFQHKNFRKDIYKKYNLN